MLFIFSLEIKISYIMANMPLCSNCILMAYHSRAKTKSKKIQNSTPRLPLLLSNEAETDGERHLRGERQLRRLHQPHRPLHGWRYPQLPLCCGHLVHAGWWQNKIWLKSIFFICFICSRHLPTRACTRGWTIGTWQQRTTSQLLATGPSAPTTLSTLPMLPWETATLMCQVEDSKRISWSEWMLFRWRPDTRVNVRPKTGRSGQIVLDQCGRVHVRPQAVLLPPPAPPGRQ